MINLTNCLNFRSDTALQDIVEKLVPGFIEGSKACNFFIVTLHLEGGILCRLLKSVLTVLLKKPDEMSIDTQRMSEALAMHAVPGLHCIIIMFVSLLRM